MKITVFPEAYINSTNNLKITDTHNAILCRNVLRKYQNQIIDNPDGCIFKISHDEKIDEDNTWKFNNYVSCLEFTAPDDTAFVSNIVFDDLSSKIMEKISDVFIEPFTPPQATQISVEIKEELIDLSPDIKNTLESILLNKYKFLRIGQYIPYLDNKIIISDMKPHEICLINNTDVEVTLNIIKKNNIVQPELDSNEGFEPDGKDEDKQPDSPPIRLTPQELREKRLAAFEKKNKT